MADTIHSRVPGAIHILSAGLAQPVTPLPNGVIALALVLHGDDQPESIAAAMSVETAAVIIAALEESAARLGYETALVDVLHNAREAMRNVPQRGHYG